MKILVFGSNGQLGRCIFDQLKNSSYDQIFLSRKDVDLTNFNDTQKIIHKIDPNIIINASAYTAVDDAENNKEIAYAVNNLAVANIAKAALKVGAILIHVSTDYVFDGMQNFPYKENSPTNPLGVYGRSKLLGENEIKKINCKFIIIRTSWVFSEYGTNFVKTILRLAKNEEKLNIINDEYGCPTYAQDLANYILNIILDIEKKDFISGIYNYCGNSSCSWFEFAKIILKEAKETIEVIPIPSSEYITIAKRPKYSVLDMDKTIKKFSIEPSDWRFGVCKVINILNRNNENQNSKKEC